MDKGTSMARRPGVRRASALTALGLVLSLFVLVQQPASAAPRAGAGVSAQVDFRQLICPILADVRDDFDDAPFFGAAVVTIDALRAEFGCTGAPATTTTVAPTTTTTVAPTPTTIVVPIPGGSFGQLACAVLLGVGDFFQDAPFFSGFGSIIDLVIRLFGCNVSG